MPGFVNIDINYSSATDYVCDISTLPCPDSSVDRIEAYHVIEHLSPAAATAALREWLRVLRSGAVLVLECPDFEETVRQYLGGDGDRLLQVYGRQRFAGDAHHWGYTAASLTHLLTHLGYANAMASEPEDYHKLTEPCIRVTAEKA